MDVIGQIKRGPELKAFFDFLGEIAVARAKDEIHEVLVTVDDDGIKVKVNGGPWSRPYGRMKP